MFLTVFIASLLLMVYGLLIEYYRRAWNAIPAAGTADHGGVPERDPEHDPEHDAGHGETSITVIIPARNEERNIRACLDSLSKQTYPRALFQVLVINDQSTDKTWEILQDSHYPGLRLECLQLADYLPAGEQVSAPKKFAIETAVRRASGELIVTTDADCYFHPDWLKSLARFYENKKARFIAAPVRIEAGHSFLGIFQALDFIVLQGITGAAVHRRFHSMCNGANLAYSRQAFHEVDGFRGIDSIPSGDDMFLMHKIYSRYPDRVFFLKDKKGIVSTQAETSWRGFFNQRIRWASKADRYEDKRIFYVLLLVYIVNLQFLFFGLASCWNSWWLFAGLLLLLMKTLIELPFVRTVAAFFGQQRLCLYFPFMQPFHIFYTVFVGWLGKFGSYRWKDRKINT